MIPIVLDIVVFLSWMVLVIISSTSSSSGFSEVIGSYRFLKFIIVVGAATVILLGLLIFDIRKFIINRKNINTNKPSPKTKNLMGYIVLYVHLFFYILFGMLITALCFSHISIYFIIVFSISQLAFLLRVTYGSISAIGKSY